jgi:hypothetical protein
LLSIMYPIKILTLFISGFISVGKLFLRFLAFRFSSTCFLQNSVSAENID